MVANPSPQVFGPDGLLGTLAPDAPPEPGRAVILLTGGGRAVVPRDALTTRADGKLYLAVSAHDLRRQTSDDALRAGQSVTVPIVSEQIVVDKRLREAGKVVVHVEPREREEVIHLPLEEEQIDVQRVPVNRFVDGPVAVREEGDVTIVPVLEEVLVVEKRLMVREEVRITRRKVTTRHTQRVTLRSEEVHVLESPAGAPAAARGGKPA